MSTHTLSLVKGGHRYVFRYGSGCEEQIVDEITRLADDHEANLDWLDAASLSFKVAQSAAAACQQAYSYAAEQEQ